MILQKNNWTIETRETKKLIIVNHYKTTESNEKLLMLQQRYKKEDGWDMAILKSCINSYIKEDGYKIVSYIY